MEKITIVDNFEQIRGLLKFDSDDDFYFVELLQRKKDNPDFGSNNRLIKYYLIDSIDYFNKVENEIKTISDATGARVYINLNRRSFKNISLQSMKLIAQYVADGNYKAIINVMTSCCGKYRSETDPTWILDIDYNDENFPYNNREVNDAILFAERQCEPIGEKYKTVIPTLNGQHIIIKPFNLKKFSEKYPEIAVHKNNPTLLYFNKNGKNNLR
jgi:hypothetical protein